MTLHHEPRQLEVVKKKNVWGVAKRHKNFKPLILKMKFTSNNKWSRHLIEKAMREIPEEATD